MTTDGQPRRPTVKDVARLAGVSASTVSNVLHDHPYVTADKRSRVERVIDQIGYRPSLIGRQLRGSQQLVLSLAVPDIRSPYFADLAHVMLLEAHRRNLTLFIDETNGSLAEERRIALGYPGRGVDGVIFCPVTISAEELAGLGSDIPLVLLGEHVLGVRCDHVAIDSRGSAVEATLHLLERGRRRFAFAGAKATSASSPARFRLEGLRQTLHDHGLELASELTFPDAAHSREAGWELGHRLVDQGADIDALVCAADLLAVGALAAFRSRGVEVPGEVAILGWDDSPEGRFTVPPLTSVAHDMAAIARRSLDALLRRQRGSELEPEQVIVEHRLIIRGSTGG